MSRVKYIQNVSLRQCGSRLREQAAALVSVIHSVGSFFQMDHPSRETMAQSSPSTFPCLYKGHWRSGPPSVRLRQPRWSLIYYFLFHLKVAGQTASFISFYEQGMRDQDSWDSHWHEAENCSCTNLIVKTCPHPHPVLLLCLFSFRKTVFLFGSEESSSQPSPQRPPLKCLTSVHSNLK